MCKSMHDQGPHHPQATKHPSVIIPSYKWVQDLPYALGPSPRVPRLHMATSFSSRVQGPLNHQLWVQGPLQGFFIK